MKRFLLLLPPSIVLATLLTLVVFNIFFKSPRSGALVTPITAFAAQSDTVTVDFARQTATGSPLVFGGAHAPNLDHQDAWDALKDAGVTMIRRDFFLEYEVPANSTLEEYKNNVHDVQNPDTWNRSADWTNITVTNQIYENAKKRGVQVLAILSYAPKWLTYSGNQYGVPKDWNVYEDIVKKSYRLHRPYLDMVEIWNEPDIEMFLDLTGSGLSRKEAYSLIFEHAVNAIKSVDKEIGDGKKVLILAPAAALPDNTDILDYLLSKPISKYIDGVSVHSYERDEPSWATYAKVMKKYGKDKLPIYVTEWNKTSEYIKNSGYISADTAIPFTAKKLVQFLKYGIAGANYYSTTYFDPNSPSKYTNAFGFYTRPNNKTELLPQGKTWHLLSRSLALGAGISRIYDINQPDTVEAIGFTNSASEKGLALVNEATVGITVGVSLKNVKIPKNATAKLYIASGSDDPKTPFCTQDVTTALSNPTFGVNVPPQSVVGILFTPPKLTFNTLLRVLGISTTRDCLPGL